jgi:hypothetical protein
VAISTIDMCALASRVTTDRVTIEDLQLAERLIMELVRRLPADSALNVL